MADYSMGVEVVSRVKFRLKTPANGVELSKMLYAAAQKRAHQLGIAQTSLSDDALKVDVGDDEIVIWWESPGDGEAGHTG
jgi:hypothetical protein